ncbi:MAG: hypothetical protein IPH84_18365 [Bacteroidales bacterium]|nr:hypothetical protein [Bacteroidales bacterium]
MQVLTLQFVKVLPTLYQVQPLHITQASFGPVQEQVFLSDATTLTPTYTPAVGETGVITLTLTATSASPCVDATDQMTITITPAATVNAGADATICETGSYTLAGSAVANATTLLWSTSGTGTFNNISAPASDLYPSAADITAGAVTSPLPQLQLLLALLSVMLWCSTSTVRLPLMQVLMLPSVKPVHIHW